MAKPSERYVLSFAELRASLTDRFKLLCSWLFLRQPRDVPLETADVSIADVVA
jgi:hypothetical protein